MGRGAHSLARVAVVVRAGAAPLWWLGLLGAAVGALVPGLTGRRIGLLTGAALFIVALAVTSVVRRRRYTHFADTATRAGRGDVLQDRAVTLRLRRKALRWWLVGAFAIAVVSSFALPGAIGLALAGVGAGLWAKALWLGRRERDTEQLLWLRTDWTGRGAVGEPVKGFRTTGVAAGDAALGGGRRRR
ncbi:hypothetical protein AB0G74_04570 [Streptomyces sp. NPDC020875]|uniref:hypothetical protein n=1 Tax=Streptomyces sp. NPDC020875 TaxID=3154898 RepID=UPI0033C35FD9